MDDIYVKSIKDIMNGENIEEYETRNDTEQFQGDNYMGTIMRIKIIANNKSGEEVIKNFIIKTSPNSLQVRNLVSVRQFYSTEVYAYQNIFPQFQKLQNTYKISQENMFPFIECYHTSLEEPNEFLIIKDVGPDGFVMSPRKKPLDLNHIKIILQYLARYHALSFALRKLEPDVYKEVAKNVEVHKGYNKNIQNFIDHVIKNALNYIQNEEYKERFAKVASYEHTLVISSPELHHPYNVLCHGDFWQSNILCRYENGNPVDVRFVDWQHNKHSSPVIDISHILFSATEQSVRVKHYEDLLNIYYKALSHSLLSMNCDPQELYPEAVFRQQLKDILVYGLIYGAVGLTFALRENEDLEDLETSVNNVIRDNEYKFGFKNPSSASNFTQRLEDIIGHFIKVGLI